MRAFLVAVTLAGCARSFAEPPAAVAPAATAPRRATHGIPGESMEIAVELRGITVGRVQVAVGQPGLIEGRPAIIVRSRAVSAGLVALIGDLSWELTTALDLELGHPLTEHEELHLAVPGRRAEHETHDRTRPSGLNVHAVAGQLRAWRSQPGERLQTEVTFADFSLELDLTDTGRALVGKLPAVRYEGKLKDRFPIRLWISDDEARVPLRMIVDSKIGTFSAELVDYDAPKDI
jgi:hypothetical protein